MNLSIGVNNKKKLKALRKMTKIPKTSYSNYYSYKYSGEPSYNSHNESQNHKKSFLDSELLENSKCYLQDMMGKNKYKTLAVAGVGASLGVLGAYMLKKRY